MNIIPKIETIPEYPKTMYENIMIIIRLITINIKFSILGIFIFIHPYAVCLIYYCVVN